MKICDVCGDAGFNDCLAICTKCKQGAEHVYCMSTIPETVPQDWVCEGCKMQEQIKPPLTKPCIKRLGPLNYNPPKIKLIDFNPSLSKTNRKSSKIRPRLPRFPSQLNNLAKPKLQNNGDLSAVKRNQVSGSGSDLRQSPTKEKDSKSCLFAGNVHNGAASNAKASSLLAKHVTWGPNIYFEVPPNAAENVASISTITDEEKNKIRLQCPSLPPSLASSIKDVQTGNAINTSVAPTSLASSFKDVEIGGEKNTPVVKDDQTSNQKNTSIVPTEAKNVASLPVFSDEYKNKIRFQSSGFPSSSENNTSVSHTFKDVQTSSEKNALVAPLIGIKNAASLPVFKNPLVAPLHGGKNVASLPVITDEKNEERVQSSGLASSVKDVQPSKAHPSLSLLCHNAEASKSPKEGLHFSSISDKHEGFLEAKSVALCYNAEASKSPMEGLHFPSSSDKLEWCVEAKTIATPDETEGKTVNSTVIQHKDQCSESLNDKSNDQSNDKEVSSQGLLNCKKVGVDMEEKEESDVSEDSTLVLKQSPPRRPGSRSYRCRETSQKIPSKRYRERESSPHRERRPDGYRASHGHYDRRHEHYKSDRKRKSEYSILNDSMDKSLKRSKSIKDRDSRSPRKHYKDAEISGSSHYRDSHDKSRHRDRDSRSPEISHSRSRNRDPLKHDRHDKSRHRDRDSRSPEISHSRSRNRDPLKHDRHDKSRYGDRDKSRYDDSRRHDRDSMSPANFDKNVLENSHSKSHHGGSLDNPKDYERVTCERSKERDFFVHISSPHDDHSQHLHSAFMSSSISRMDTFVYEEKATPISTAMWSGSFVIRSETIKVYKDFQAHPSSKAANIVYEKLSLLPSPLHLEELKRGAETDTWPPSFQKHPPTSDHIGMYFFPQDMQSHDNWFKPLVDRLCQLDLVLKLKLDFAQLLIFPSTLLPEPEQRWDEMVFLWGSFRRNKPEHNSLQINVHKPADGDPLPQGNGEVIDMEIDMELTENEPQTLASVETTHNESPLQNEEDECPPLPPGVPPIDNPPLPPELPPTPWPPLPPVCPPLEPPLPKSLPFYTFMPAHVQFSPCPPCSESPPLPPGCPPTDPPLPPPPPLNITPLTSVQISHVSVTNISPPLPLPPFLRLPSITPVYQPGLPLIQPVPPRS